MNILLTGATGNVGKAVLRHVNDWEDTITAVSRSGGKVKLSNMGDFGGCAVADVQALDLNKSWSYLQLWCKEQLYPFDLVIMAHGTQKPATINTMTEDDWLSIWYDNTSSCIGLTQALVKENKINRGGLIVYCSSIQANTPRVGRGLYAASKAALEAFGKTVAVELAKQYIRCVTLRLGQLTETMGGVVFSPEERERLERRALLPWVDPYSVAKLCFDLYEQPSLTGTVIEVDSGQGRNVW